MPDDARSHAVNLAGVWIASEEKVPVFCRTGFMLVAKRGVTLKIAVRSQAGALNVALAGAIR